MECAYCSRKQGHRLRATSLPQTYSDKLTITYQCRHCKAETTLCYALEGIQWEIDHYDELVYKKKRQSS